MHRYLVIGICSLIYLLDGLVHSVLGPLAPQMARTLSISLPELGPVLSANLLGQCIGLVVLPAVTGHLGHRRVILITLAGFGIAQAASALSGSAMDLILWRLLAGFFLGGCLPSGLAMVAAAAPPGRMGIAVMVIFTGYGLGAALAGLVPALFESWPTAMVVIGAACMSTVFIAWLWLREPEFIDERDSENLSGAAAVRQVLSPPYGIGTLLLWLLFIALLTISYCLNSWLPTLLVKVGWSESLAAMSVTVFSMGGIVAAPCVGLLIDRWGVFRVLTVFLSVSSVALYGVGQLLEVATPGVLLLLLALCGFTALGAYGGVNVVLAAYYPRKLQATGIGWAKSVGRLGTVLAPVMIGLALSGGMSEAWIMSSFAVPALLSMLSLVGISMTRAARDQTT